MKSYVTDRQIRLVGKAWEIKRQLKLMLQQGGQHITLMDYAAGLHNPQQRKLPGSKQDPAIIPFPSR
ncbi:Z-ring formation inhibitor MciZ [Paenibacillus sp. LMG 31457]|uniref:Z-ring formation inhibitor MciZ n=1 Tax=Paenibacillus planticolens TaxID=2654976 RepID=A0ABX1ZHY7_9BACL|nr:Z-ring formation inhibitor MciZ [Paenibacillus planticolens]